MQKGFTLIELLVVLAIMATLLSIAAPKYYDSVDRAKEAALRSDLAVLREAIDKFHADTGHYPSTLQALADGRYVRSVPIDPITDKRDWVPEPQPDGQTEGIYNVHSSAPGAARDGTAYGTW